MTEVYFSKTIPTSSDYYGYGGLVTINFAGIYSLTPHFKKSLIKVQKPKSKSRQSSSPSDKFDNNIIDLKKGTDEISVRGWLEDENYSGTATAGGATTLTDSGASWIVNQYTGATITILSGTGSGQSRTVASNTSTVITISSAWSVNPNSTSVYLIQKTAWTKFWQARAMISTGGSLTGLTIGNITFSSSTQEAFMEELTGNINPDDTGGINVNFGKDIARIDISINFFIGDAR
jgi:hypothetical protein